MPLPPPHRLTSSAATIEIYDHGAHLVSWVPAGREPVLWMSGRSQFEPGAPIRGGVPICWPWFGAGLTGDRTPAHGVARTTAWRLLETTEAPEHVSARYRLTDDDVDAFGSPFLAEYTVTAGECLDLALTITNAGDVPITMEEALHAYIRVGDVTRIRIDGLDGAAYLDRAPDATPGWHRQDGPLTFTGETDRIYRSTGDITVVDAELNREITIARTGSADAVVWNPWVAKSAAMSDFGDDEWPTTVCVEGANVVQDAIVVQPGQSHTLCYAMRVQ